MKIRDNIEDNCEDLNYKIINANFINEDKWIKRLKFEEELFTVPQMQNNIEEVKI